MSRPSQVSNEEGDVPWNLSHLSKLAGKRVVITGATSGLGKETALALAAAGAELLVTARDDSKASALAKELAAACTNTFELLELDLADLNSVRNASSRLLGNGRAIDVLINNAGIMIPPLAHTADGFELQMGTNHLGHFAWTAQLWPLLTNARIVTVSSLAHAQTNGIDLRSLTTNNEDRRYRRWKSYAESKLANLLFSLELHRRIERSSARAQSVAAHPGVSSTNLMTTGTALNGQNLLSRGVEFGGRIFGQNASEGALPTLMAASDSSLSGGEFVGPEGWRQLRGHPRLVGRSRAARDQELARTVWAASEAATGVTFAVED